MSTQPDTDLTKLAITHTVGPWRWEVNHKSRHIQLCGGKPKFDLTVMDFVRWGMGGAAPRFLRPFANSSLMILEQATRYAEIVPGREHHSEWFQTLNHPDANLIAAAPDLLAALKLLTLVTCDPLAVESTLTLGEIRATCAAAIAKAEGR